MTKYRKLEGELLAAGWEKREGGSHTKFVKDGRMVVVPRHREVKDQTARQIRRDAGLR